MSALQAIAEDRRNEIIADSIRGGVHAVLCRQCADGWQAYKGVFDPDSGQTEMVCIKVHEAQGEKEVVLPEPGEPIGVTFRKSHKKCMFVSRVRSCGRRPDGIVVEIQWPDSLQQLQRRSFQRAAPPRNTVIPVRFWREKNPHTSSPDDRQVRHGQLEDLSAGGMRIKTGDLADIELGALYRCVFSPRAAASAMMLDALLKHHEVLNQGRASIGFHFIGLEMTPEGQGLLDRLAHVVNQFQRSRARPQR